MLLVAIFKDNANPSWQWAQLCFSFFTLGNYGGEPSARPIPNPVLRGSSDAHDRRRSHLVTPLFGGWEHALRDGCGVYTSVEKRFYLFNPTWMSSFVVYGSRRYEWLTKLQILLSNTPMRVQFGWNPVVPCNRLACDLATFGLKGFDIASNDTVDKLIWHQAFGRLPYLGKCIKVISLPMT